MKPFFYNVSILACVSTDVVLIVYFLIELAIFDMVNILVLVLSGVIFVVTLVVTQRDSIFPSDFFSNWFRMNPKVSEVALPAPPRIGLAKSPKAIRLEEIQSFEASPDFSVASEIGTHHCPIHGAERCAGNLMKLHSCNAQSSSYRQIYWQERKPIAAPKKKKLQMSLG